MIAPRLNNFFLLTTFLVIVNNCVGFYSPPCETCCDCVTTYYFPICASNGQIYNNVCLFNCARSFYLFSSGLILSMLQVPCFNGFDQSLQLQPVTNQYQYSAMDYLNWYKYFYDAYYSSGGPVGSTEGPNSEPSGETTTPGPETELCLCTDDYNPVCDKSGKEYKNKCLFDCANKQAGGELEEGECEDEDSSKSSGSDKETSEEDSDEDKSDDKSKSDEKSEKSDDEKSTSDEDGSTEKSGEATTKSDEATSEKSDDGTRRTNDATTGGDDATTEASSDDGGTSTKGEGNDAESTTKSGEETSTGEEGSTTEESTKSTEEETSTVAAAARSGFAKRGLPANKMKSSQKKSNNWSKSELQSSEESSTDLILQNILPEKRGCKSEELSKTIKFLKRVMSTTSKCETCCKCPKTSIPVCASNGKMYNNTCFFECAKTYLAQKGEDITKVPCSKKTSTDIQCKCSTEEDPVCASNGNQYINRCFFECAKKKKKNIIEKPCVAARGLSEPEPGDKCTCPKKFDPVCASNGKQYTNDCKFKCAQKKDLKLKKVPCKNGTKLDIGKCSCSMEFYPVCSSDGEILPNQCVFNCYRKQIMKTKGIEVKIDKMPCFEEALKIDPSSGTIARRFGEEEAAPTCESCCKCGSDVDPYCAQDGAFYPNKCLFDCAKKFFATKNYTLVPGTCPDIKAAPKSRFTSCECSKKVDPVCASNGKVYDNECLFRCEQKTLAEEGVHIRITKHDCKKPTSAASNGTTAAPSGRRAAPNGRATAPNGGASAPKGSTAAPNNKSWSCNCSNDQNPVCDQNGNKYQNRCFFQCERSYAATYQKKNLEEQKCKDVSSRRQAKGKNGKEESSKSDCLCPNIYFPVCASDGETYFNECHFNCARKKAKTSGKNITITQVPCFKNNFQMPQKLDKDEKMWFKKCGCPKTGVPVCASNGKRYQNDCYFECHKSYHAKKNDVIFVRVKFPCHKEDDLDTPGSNSTSLNSKIAKRIEMVSKESSGTLNLGKGMGNSVINSTTSSGTSNLRRGMGTSAIKSTSSLGNSNLGIRTTNSGSYKYTPSSATSNFGNIKSKQFPTASTSKMTTIKKESGSRSITIKGIPNMQGKRMESGCRCSSNYYPVCASNGERYHNECFFLCFKNKLKGTLNIYITKIPCFPKTTSSKKRNKKKGTQTPKNDLETPQNIEAPKELEAPITVCEKTCPKFQKPICTSNGRKYRNICYFGCDKNSYIFERIPCGTFGKRLEIEHKSRPGTALLEEEGKTTLLTETAINPNYEDKDYSTTKASASEDSKSDNILGLVQVPDEVDYNSEIEPEEKCKCPEVYLPVCASNRKRYFNYCQFKCAQKRLLAKGITLSILRNPCFPKSSSGSKATGNSRGKEVDKLGTSGQVGSIANKEKCSCPKTYSPVCASNKRRYPNLCVFECTRKKFEATGIKIKVIKNPCFPKRGSKGEARINQEGEEETDFDDGKIEGVDPEDESYQDSGEMEADVNADSDSGADEVVDKKCIQKCPKRYFPVCASNEKRYFNNCQFRCSQKRLEARGIRIKITKTPCFPEKGSGIGGGMRTTRMEERYTTHFPGNSPDCEDCCPCPIITFPVCGSNGKKYRNQCAFECAKKYLEHHGSRTFLEIIPCPDGNNEVVKTSMISKTEKIGKHGKLGITEVGKIGSYGKSGKVGKIGMYGKVGEIDPYGTDAIKTHGTVEVYGTVGTYGKVGEIGKVYRSPSCEDCCSCPEVEYPVCASNGKKYKNDCFFECAKNYLLRKKGEHIARMKMPCTDSGEVKNSSGNEKYAGEAKSISKFAGNCDCSNTYFPVCASNGIIYPNYCTYNCDKKFLKRKGENLEVVKAPCFKWKQPEKKGLTQLVPQESHFRQVAIATSHKLATTLPEPSRPPKCESCCQCPDDNHLSICASNGKKYRNKCLFDCAKAYLQTKGISLSVKAFPCFQEDSVESEDNTQGAPSTVPKTLVTLEATPKCEVCCKCPKTYLPVCASNGKKYDNKCQYACAKNYLLSKGISITITEFPCGDSSYSSSESEESDDSKMDLQYIQVTPGIFPSTRFTSWEVDKNSGSSSEENDEIKFRNNPGRPTVTSGNPGTTEKPETPGLDAAGSGSDEIMVGKVPGMPLKENFESTEKPYTGKAFTIKSSGTGTLTQGKVTAGDFRRKSSGMDSPEDSDEMIPETMSTTEIPGTKKLPSGNFHEIPSGEGDENLPGMKNFDDQTSGMESKGSKSEEHPSKINIPGKENIDRDSSEEKPPTEKPPVTTSLKRSMSKSPQCENCCKCPHHYSPICASNGSRYQNDCMFKCAQTYLKNKERKMIKQVPCKKKKTIKKEDPFEDLHPR